MIKSLVKESDESDLQRVEDRCIMVVFMNWMESEFLSHWALALMFRRDEVSQSEPRRRRVNVIPAKRIRKAWREECQPCHLEGVERDEAATC